MFYFSPCVLSTILRYNHMQINKINKSSTNFTGMLNNKILLKGLEKISEHGTSFAAGTSLVMALGVRPLAILSTPNTEKENKQYASTNSICSGLIKFGLVEAVALPVENAVKKIDQNPQKYLKQSTIKNLQSSSKNLLDSKSYNLATQILKLGTGFLTAIPKSMLTIALLPILMDKIFHIKKNDTQTTITKNQPQTKHKIQNSSPSTANSQTLLQKVWAKFSTTQNFKTSSKDINMKKKTPQNTSLPPQTSCLHLHLPTKRIRVKKLKTTAKKPSSTTT